MHGRRLPEGEFRALVDNARDRQLLSGIAGRYTQLKKRGREMVGLCPFHSERTPSFEVNDAKGTYFCHGCHEGGDAITLLTKLDGMTFVQAVEALSGEDVPEVAEEERAKRREADAVLNQSRIDFARWLWGRTTSAVETLVETYARSRGITAPLPDTVRFAAAPRFVDYETGEYGREFPAVCCALQDRAGDITGVQLIFLAPDGSGKWQGKGAAKMTRGQLIGSALRLGPVREHIVQVEGPEDGWTLMQRLPDHSIWATCGTANYSAVDWPPEIKSICLAGDNGSAGRAAVAEARAAALARGIRPTDVFPDRRYKDWNDELRGIAV